MGLGFTTPFGCLGDTLHESLVQQVGIACFGLAFLVLIVGQHVLSMPSAGFCPFFSVDWQCTLQPSPKHCLGFVGWIICPFGAVQPSRRQQTGSSLQGKSSISFELGDTLANPMG